MNKLSAATASLLPALLLCTTVFSTPVTAAKPMLVPGEQAQSQTAKLTGEIQWHKDLSSAQAAARTQGKMIFWMHMLGDLDGTT